MANEAPPAEIVETIPAAPGPDFFWIGGHWNWNGTDGYGSTAAMTGTPIFTPVRAGKPATGIAAAADWIWHEGHWR
jgi:hypothetical protein